MRERNVIYWLLSNGAHISTRLGGGCLDISYMHLERLRLLPCTSGCESLFQHPRRSSSAQGQHKIGSSVSGTFVAGPRLITNLGCPLRAE